MAYDIEEHRRTIERFLAGIVEPANIDLKPGLDFDAVFIRYPEGLRAIVSYLPFEFDDARHGPFALVDDTLVLRATSKRRRGAGDLFVLDGISHASGGWIGRTRLYAAYSSDGSLLVSWKESYVRAKTRPKPEVEDPVAIDEPYVRTAQDEIDDAAIEQGF